MANVEVRLKTRVPFFRDNKELHKENRNVETRRQKEK